jgi:hypothetical protein
MRPGQFNALVTFGCAENLPAIPLQNFAQDLPVVRIVINNQGGFHDGKIQFSTTLAHGGES